MTRCTKYLVISILFIFFNTLLFSEIIQNDSYNFSLDLPEGYVFEGGSKDNKSFSFTHPNIPVSLLIKIYDGKEFFDSKYTLHHSIEKLQPNAEIDEFDWNNSKCCISYFDFTLDKDYCAYAICSPLSKNDSYIVLVCYCPKNEEDFCGPFVMSSINSLCVNYDFYNYPGIIMNYAFPKEGIKNIDFKLYGKSISTFLDKSDEEASQYLVDMEFSVLSLYVSHNLWKEAWQRYYRLIFRDSFGRMEDCINKILSTFAPYAAQINKEKPELSLAQMILTWVQSMKYPERHPGTFDSDFVSLPRAFCGEPCDCDSRAMMVCLFMRAMGLESFILISPEYSHALAAVEIDAPGQKYIPEGTEREFLMGETTEAVTWGMIAESQADRSKWFPAYLP